MRKLVTSLFLLTAVVTGLAQKSNRENQLRLEADKYYNDEQYTLAIQYYQELSNLSEQQADLNFQLAESYRKTFNYVEAEAYYLKVYYQAPLEFPLSVYYYAMMLKLNHEFDESIAYFTEFIYANQYTKELTEYVEQAIVDRAGSEMAKAELFKNKIDYQIGLESMNTGFNDYAPAVLDSTTLVITSGRVESNRDAIDQRYGEAFTNNFYFTKNGKRWQDRTKQLFQVMNTRYNDGPGCFNYRRDKYYFTVCGKDGPQCRIFLSVWKNNKWTEPIALNDNINIRNFESKHPGISKGGDTLLFSSDRLGGFGKFDIWMSINSGNDQWGPAINLGNSINTKLNELAPAFSAFSHIFFISSDGHQNYGGLDLYMAKRFSTGTLALYNLDYPFNSTRDDCFISFTERKAYVSSNREGGEGGFDIYAVQIPSVVSFVSKLSLKNKDARGDVKLNARTEKINTLDLIIARNEDRIEYENLTYEKKKIVDQMIFNRIHKIPGDMDDFKDLTETDYQLLKRISETQYKTQEMEKRFTKTLLARVSPSVHATQVVSVTGELRDSVSNKLLPSRKIFLMDESGEVLKITTTNERGEFKFTNINAGQLLFIRLENLLNATTGEKPVIVDLKIMDFENYSTSTFENIYFDFDRYRLRPEAKQVLNDLSIFLKNYPSVQVEMYAYADEVGTEDYNMILTQKRGQAVLNYLKGKGVDETALAIIAKGRQENLQTDIEIQRQFNRRVEFYLNGVQLNPSQAVKTYILKKKSNWNLISATTGVKIEELKRLNGVSAEELQIFQPIRIPSHAKEISDELFFTLH